MIHTKNFFSSLLLSVFSIPIKLGQEITQVAGTASLEKAQKKETASLTVAMTQTSGPNPVTTAGQIITYKIIVSNTGTKKIKKVNTTETYPGDGKGTLSPARESISNNNVLDVDETWRYTATYTVTAADISAGSSLVNTISVVTIQVPGPTIATATTGVASPIIPTFAQIGPLCQNSKPPVLPSTSTNGITGIWKPSTISTTTVGIRTYTFTSTVGRRASTTTMNIVVTPQIIPAFTQIGPLCRNSTPPALPTSSNNTSAIIGIWSPATISTATVGIKTYTFTPSAGQCASKTTMNIVVTNTINPTFTQIGPLWQGSTAPALPSTSNNTPAITGTWSPATISTATVGIKTYTFTPSAGQCASKATMNIVVTNTITPTFTQIGPLCQGSVAPILPLSSTNAPAIAGTWSPATISTALAGTTTYTFTPTAGQCASKTTMNIVVTNTITPTFTGTWSPATISTATVGTKTYTFTPSAGQCAMTTTLMVTVNSLPTVSFTTQPGANSSIGVDVTYTTQPGMTNYIWGFPGTAGVDYSITSGGTVGDNTVVLKYLTPGNKIVTINYTSGVCTVTSATSSTATLVTALPVATTTTVTVSDAIYDGIPHGGTAVVTGAGGFTQTLTVIYTGVAPTVYGPTSTAPTNAGTYSVTASFAGNDNYNSSSCTASITIGKMVVGVTADAKTKIYGQLDKDLTYQITSGSLLNGDTFSGSLTRDAGENVGPYAISQGTLTLGSNYAINFTGANLTITPLPVTVTAGAKTKVYGQADPALTFVSSPAVGAVMANGKVISFTGSLSRDGGESVAGSPYAINQGSLANSNYIITYFGANLTITPLPVTVTAEAKSKMYGQNDPILTFVSVPAVGTQLANDEGISFTGSLTRLPGETVAGSPYTISQGSLANSNYTITYAGANLTITKMAIAVEAEVKTKVYGENDPSLTYHIKSGSLAFSDGFTGTLTRVSGENVGGYSIMPGSVALSSNYTITWENAQLTIKPLAVKVFADAQTKDFAQVDPPLTFVSDPAVGTVLDNGQVILFTGKLSRAQGEAVGTYPINLNTLGNSNYSVDYIGANLTIWLPTLEPPMAVIKRQTTGPNPVTAPGQVITYQIVLTNVGGDPLRDVMPTEIYPGTGAGTLSPPTESISNDNVLNVGENWTYTATYTVTAADITAGADLVNTISVVANMTPEPTLATATTPVAGTKSLTSKRANLMGSGAADVKPVLQGEFGLKAYPNPFTDHLYFELQWNKDAKARIEIFNINGTKVATIFSGDVGAEQASCFDYAPENISSGILIYRLVIYGQIIFTGKVVHK